MDKVLLDKSGSGYAVLTLNRPDALNALSLELREDFVAAFAECEADEGIRVVIVTGSGRAFCAGFDLMELGNASDNPDQVADNRMARAMEGFPGPIIGAINGHAVTGGFELALACDVLIASEHARFADTHARVGILPGWGLSQKLPRLVGLSRAKQISLSGTPVFSSQALAWGLVNEVVDAGKLLHRAKEIAEAMCTAHPGMLRRYKALIEEGYSMPYRDALAWEEREAIESARQMTVASIAGRRHTIMSRGRRETGDEQDD